MALEGGSVGYLKLVLLFPWEEANTNRCFRVPRARYRYGVEEERRALTCAVQEPFWLLCSRTGSQEAGSEAVPNTRVTMEACPRDTLEFWIYFRGRANTFVGGVDIKWYSWGRGAPGRLSPLSVCLWISAQVTISRFVGLSPHVGPRADSADTLRTNNQRSDRIAVSNFQGVALADSHADRTALECQRHCLVSVWRCEGVKPPRA